MYDANFFFFLLAIVGVKRKTNFKVEGPEYIYFDKYPGNGVYFARKIICLKNISVIDARTIKVVKMTNLYGLSVEIFYMFRYSSDF